MSHDPMYEFYEWTRKYRRRQRLYWITAWVIMGLSAVAVIAIIGGMTIWALVTFS